MTHDIESFGGDGLHQIRFGKGQQDRSMWVKRDLWFDHNNGDDWIVWAQERSLSTSDSPAEASAEAETIGSIVVTHPDVIAFLEQMANLLLEPSDFAHDPVFGPPPVESKQRDVQ